MKVPRRILLISLIAFTLPSIASGNIGTNLPNLMHDSQYIDGKTHINQTLMPGFGYEKGIEVYDNTINSGSTIGIRLRNSYYERSSVLVLDNNNDGKYNSDKDLIGNLTKTSRNKGDLYHYGIFPEPFEENNTGYFYVYVLDALPAENFSLEYFPSNRIEVENSPPEVVEQNLSTNETEFTYSFRTSEEIKQVSVLVNLNYSARDNILYNRMNLDDFKELSNNTYTSSFTVDYDGNYSVEIQGISDKHGNVANYDPTKRVSKIAPPVISHLEPNISKNLDLSQGVVFTIYDRGGEIDREKLSLDIISAEDKIVSNLTLENDSLNFEGNELDVSTDSLAIDQDYENITFELYLQDVNGKSTTEEVTYNLVEDSTTPNSKSDYLQVIPKVINLFSDLF